MLLPKLLTLDAATAHLRRLRPTATQLADFKTHLAELLKHLDPAKIERHSGAGAASQPDGRRVYSARWPRGGIEVARNWRATHSPHKKGSHQLVRAFFNSF